MSLASDMLTNKHWKIIVTFCLTRAGTHIRIKAQGHLGEPVAGRVEPKQLKYSTGHTPNVSVPVWQAKEIQRTLSVMTYL